MEIVINILASFIATFAFAIFFNAPKKAIFVCSLVGTVGWMTFYFLSRNIFDNSISNLIASMAIGLLGEFFSHKLKMPSTVFIYSGIIMLVPGYGMYHTMEYFAKKEYWIAFDVGIDTVIQAGSIAIGILISSIFSRSINRVKKDREIKIQESNN